MRIKFNKAIIIINLPSQKIHYPVSNKNRSQTKIKNCSFNIQFQTPFAIFFHNNNFANFEELK